MNVAVTLSADLALDRALGKQSAGGAIGVASMRDKSTELARGITPSIVDVRALLYATARETGT